MSFSEFEPRRDREGGLRVTYSIEQDIERVKYTLEKLPWYRERGYRLSLPVQLQRAIDAGQAMSDEDIRDAITNEFDEGRYRKAADELRERWSQVEEAFRKELSTLGLYVPESFDVRLTVYGVGGSYDLPSSVLINIASVRRELIDTIRHEAVHLVIEPLIREFAIDHWTKERLVDLTMGKISGVRVLQTDPVRAVDVNHVFEEHYPDMRTVVATIASFSGENI